MNYGGRIVKGFAHKCSLYFLGFETFAVVACVSRFRVLGVPEDTAWADGSDNSDGADGFGAGAELCALLTPKSDVIFRSV